MGFDQETGFGYPKTTGLLCATGLNAIPFFGPPKHRKSPMKSTGNWIAWIASSFASILREQQKTGEQDDRPCIVEKGGFCFFLLPSPLRKKDLSCSCHRSMQRSFFTRTLKPLGEEVADVHPGSGDSALQGKPAGTRMVLVM